MTAVTAVTSTKEISGVSGLEIAQGTFTNGQTYTSKFKTIDAVFLQSRARTGAYASVSGSIVTLHCGSASGDTFDLIIVGH